MQTSLDLNPDYLLQNEGGVSNNRKCKKLTKESSQQEEKKTATSKKSNVKINQEENVVK